MALSVLYCKVCTMPPEYCPHGPAPDKCKAWLQENEPEMFGAIYEGAPTKEKKKAKASSEKAGGADDGEGDEDEGKHDEDNDDDDDDDDQGTKKKRKAKAPKLKAAQATAKAAVTVRRVQRQKRKYVTVVAGLKTCGVETKKASKAFATHFSCSASITQPDEISIQGDVVEDLIAYLEKKFEISPKCVTRLEK